MKRVVGFVLGLGLLVGAVLFPVLLWDYSDGEEPNETTTITSYVATFDVDDQGDLSATETLTVDFPSGDKHGIFRFFDKYDQSSPNARRIPHDIDVSMDGRPIHFEELSAERGRFVNVRIGDPDVLVSPGEHVYEISYDIDGVLEEGTTGQDTQFYWNLIPGGWLQPIEQSDLTVHLPVAAEDLQCVIGAGDEERDCKAARGEGTDTITVRTKALEPNTPVTIKAGLDMPTPPAGKTVPWTAKWDPVLSTSVLLLVLVLVVAAGAGVLGFVVARRARETDPQFPLMYSPPEGIGPAQAAYLVNEDVDAEQYVATLMYAADKGAIDLTRDGEAWTITDKNGATGWAGLDEVTAGTAHILGGPGTSFTARRKDVEGGKRLKSEIDSFESSTKAWATHNGLMVKSGLGGFGGLLVIGLYIAAIILAFWNPLNMSTIALIPGLFAVFGWSLAYKGSGTRRTKAGRDVWSKAGGFRRILSTSSAEERFDFSGRQELYTAYIPWAVAFGCADEWAGKYRIETGQEPPVPAYFGPHYTAATAATAVSSMVDDFNSTVSSAISSYEATQKSSSSGGGGGGFSGGGGGGGGGGGSW